MVKKMISIGGWDELDFYPDGDFPKGPNKEVVKKCRCGNPDLYIQGNGVTICLMCGFEEKEKA